jgi:hypothetical protein
MAASRSQPSQGESSVQPIDAIRWTDSRLQQHEQFGDSSKVVARVIERYKFALEVLALRDPALRELARRVEALDAGAADAVFGDLLLRAELESSIDRLETSGPEGASGPTLVSLLTRTLDAVAAAPHRSLSRRAMARDLGVGPGGRIWVWDLPDEPTPVSDLLRERIRLGFMPGAESGVEIIRPTPDMVKGLDRACALMERLVPQMAASVFRHLHSIAVAHIRGPRGRMLTGSGGDGTPCMIFIDPTELSNPWDTAGHILHEAVHLKLSDLIRTGAGVTEDGPIELPWGRRTALSNLLFAYHAYAHMQVFRAAVEELGPALHAEFGAPRDYVAPAHAMSVVNNDDVSPYSRAEARLDHLYYRLDGPLSPRVTPYGREMVSWLWDSIRPFHAMVQERAAPRPAPAVKAEASSLGRAPSSARYRQGQDLRLRRSPATEVLFALDPSTRKIVTLNLPAWLAFELCDGKTESELLSAYTASLGVGSERAWAQLAPTLEGLVSSGMVEQVPTEGRAP